MKLTINMKNSRPNYRVMSLSGVVFWGGGLTQKRSAACAYVGKRDDMIMI